MNSLVNGEATDSFDLHDRGLHYGDGIFETLAVVDGRPRYFARHMRRLALGCSRLDLPMPDPDVVAREIDKLCAGAGRAVVKLILTRGLGERGYAPPEVAEATRILLLYPWPEETDGEPMQGIFVRTCTMRLAINAQLAGVKHLNRLEQVMASSEWRDPCIKEGIMFDNDGHLVEGIHSNVFIVSGGRLLTPLLDRCGIAGIVRGRILEIATKAGIESECCRLSRDELLAAREVFLTNTLSGILPVARIDEQRYAVGETTLRLRQLLSEDAEA